MQRAMPLSESAAKKHAEIITRGLVEYPTTEAYPHWRRKADACGRLDISQ